MMFSKPKRLVNKDLLAIVRKRKCDVCGKLSTKDSPNQACHIGTRGAGYPDEESNLYTGCFRHHQEQGQIGWAKMFEKYPFFRQIIYQKGWILDGNKKLKRT